MKSDGHRGKRLTSTPAPDGELFVEGKDGDRLYQRRGRRGGIDQSRVENEMMRLDALYPSQNWAVHTVVDGQLITGQNSASSGPAARFQINVLNK